MKSDAASDDSAAKPQPAEAESGGLGSLLRIRKPKTPKPEELQLDEPPQNAVDYELPSIDLLLASESFSFDEQEKEVRRKAKILEKTFLDFGFNIRVVEIQTGPVIAQFEVELEAGLRLSKITGLADDLAIALRVPSVRIVAPIPGKNTVGIEVPNDDAADRPPPRSHRRGRRQGRRRCGSRSSWARTWRAARWSSTWPRCRTC